MKPIRLIAVALIASISLLLLSGCSSAIGGIFIGLAYDQLMSVETSRINVENVSGVLYLRQGESFQLQIMHRQLIDNNYGRTYYEEYVTEECSYYTSAPLVARVSRSGQIEAISRGTATISAVFKLPLQKADQAHLTVVVE